MRVIALLAVVCLGSSCAFQHGSSAEQIEQMQSDIALLRQKNSELMTERENIRFQLERLELENNALALEKSNDDFLIEGLTKELASKDVTVSKTRSGDFSLSIEGKILFDPGQIEVKPAGLTVLERIATKLKNEEIMLRIDGHTDAVPVSNPNTKRHSPSNWHLACNRAVAVLKVLGKYGIAEPKMYAAGFGSTVPVVPSQKSEAKNRRVEIVLLPAQYPTVQPKS